MTDREMLDRAWKALDTANGVCQIIASGRMPVDMEDCAEEIGAALAELTDHLDGRERDR